MGLMRTVARTAVISGTAQATANAVNRRQMQRNVAAYQQAQTSTTQQAPPPPAAPASSAPAPASMDDKLAQLERLSQLRSQGVLTDEEFAEQKATILEG